METFSQENFDELKATLGDLVENSESEDLGNMATFMHMLELPEEQFALLAPGVLQSFQQTVNNPNDRLGLVATLNAAGVSVEDLNDAFAELINSADDLNISAQKRDFLKGIMGALVSVVNETEGIAKRYINVPIELCHPDAKVPQYQTVDDAGADVYAVEDVVIHPGETKIIPLGIKLAVPPGYAVLIHPRSGLSAKSKMRIANSIGLCDAGYRNEYGIIIENIEPPIKDIEYEFEEDGNIRIKSIVHGADMSIGKGDRIGQLRLVEVPKMVFYRVDSVAEIGEDRGGGFGSTGQK